MIRAFKTIIFLIAFIIGKCFAQNHLLTIDNIEGIKKDDFASSYYNSSSGNIHINLEKDGTVYRHLYDSNFVWLDKYILSSKKITFSEKLSEKQKFVSPLSLVDGSFEIYVSRSDIFIYKIDFSLKHDSLFQKFSFDETKTGEKIITLMPDKGDLKILTYNKKKNILKVYEWRPDKQVSTFIFSLPESSMTETEEAKYPKECRMKYKKTGQLGSAQINRQFPFPFPQNVYFRDNHIYITQPIPFSMGMHIIHLNLNDTLIETKNIFINDTKINFGDDPFKRKRPIAAVYDSILVVQNSSTYTFEVYFYNLNNYQLLKKHSVPVGDSIYKLLHSTIIQKGTFGSKNKEVEIKKERAFMRLMGGSFAFINLSSSSVDSITLLLSSTAETTGIEGMALEMLTMPIGFMAGIHIGNLQVIPYLTSTRKILYYAYSRFNKKTFEPAASLIESSILDNVLDSFKTRQLANNSSFLLQKENSVFIGLINEKGKFDIYNFNQ